MIETLLRRVHAALVWVVLAPVFVYRKVLSPLKGRSSCRFLPTCSEYAIDAVKQRGIVVGSALAVGRVLRCNPLFEGGFDPVPGRRTSCHCDLVDLDPGAGIDARPR